jgi:sulfur relay (sulfurtransferase) DsrF/TusC family protein
MRLALSFYAEGAPVSIALEGDGVLNWVSGMSGPSASPQSVNRFVEDLARFGVPVYILAKDLVENGLTAGDLASAHAKVISEPEYASLLRSFDSVVAI